jgi:hypothetical protein
MGRDQRHIAIINGIYPPDKGASGVVVAKLADILEQSGIQVSVVTSSKSYYPSGETGARKKNTYVVKSRNVKTSKIFRLFFAIQESIRLLIKAKRIDPDVYFVCTDPSLLPLFSSILLKKKNWILWQMDVYPEAFVSHGLISKKNPIFFWYKKVLNKFPPNAMIYLGDKQKNHFGSTDENRTSVIIPCGLVNEKEVQNSDENQRTRKEVIRFAYCGNLGEAHSDHFLRLVVKLSDPTKHIFTFSVLGSKAVTFRNACKNNSNAVFVDWIPEDEMSKVDIQIVTLRSEWTHVCVPSKAVSSICFGVPILFHGSNSGDIYYRFQNALWHIEDNENMEEAINNFYKNLTLEEILKKKKATQDLRVREFQEYRSGSKYLIKIINES